MDFRKALVSSLGAPAAKPVVRLTAEDIARANLHQPGYDAYLHACCAKSSPDIAAYGGARTLSRLLKKLERVSHVRNARGSACQRCRSQKKRCDGGGPCSLCAAAGTNCSNCNKDPEGLEISPQDATDFLETLTHPSPEPPLSRTFVASPVSPHEFAMQCAILRDDMMLLGAMSVTKARCEGYHVPKHGWDGDVVRPGVEERRH